MPQKQDRTANIAKTLTLIKIKEAKGKTSLYTDIAFELLQTVPQRKEKLIIEELTQATSDWSLLYWLMPQTSDRTSNIAKTLTLKKTKEACKKASLYKNIAIDLLKTTPFMSVEGMSNELFTSV